MGKGLYKIISLKKIAAALFAVVFSVVFVFTLEIFYVKTSARAKSEETPIIIIDAGHGGEDGGTSSSSGIIEKNINLAISLNLKDFFETAGFNVIMTREDDNLIYDSSCTKMREKKVSDIHNRMKIINDNPNSIFLSIHQNHFEQSQYCGTQVFYSKGNPQSEAIAQVIQQNIAKALQPDNTRKIKPSGTEIYLLHNAKTPAVMVECGFLSNPGEAQKLTDDEYQTQISMVIFQSIVEYLSTGK